MVDYYRIKEHIIPAFAVNGSNLGPFFTPINLNGEIQKITFQGINTPGSVYLGESGTNIEFYRNNAFATTGSNFEVYPITYGVTSTNGNGSPQTAQRFVYNNHLYIGASGMSSGTDKTFGPVKISYR